MDTPLALRFGKHTGHVNPNVIFEGADKPLELRFGKPTGHVNPNVIFGGLDKPLLAPPPDYPWPGKKLGLWDPWLPASNLQSTAASCKMLAK